MNLFIIYIVIDDGLLVDCVIADTFKRTKDDIVGKGDWEIWRTQIQKTHG